MKAIMNRVPAFNIKVGDVDLGTFLLADKWKGFTEFRNTEGQSLFAYETNTGKKAAEIFIDAMFLGPNDKGTDQDFVIVSGTPSLMDKIKNAKAEQEQ